MRALVSVSTLQYYDEAALLERLSNALKRRTQEVVFLVGSPLSAPTKPDLPGVPGVAGVISLIQKEFETDPAQLSALNDALELEGGNGYQAAFAFLQGRRGQRTANEIIRQAVLAARVEPCKRTDLSDDECRSLEQDNQGWALSPGILYLGLLLAEHSNRFGRSVLTTNFDPLIEVSIRRGGARIVRTNLHADGDLTQTEGDDCHVIHLHGYWYGSDTLHTNRQLIRPRPHLKDSLASLLRNKLIVVCGYGAWDDVFTEALMAVVRDDTAYPEILWTFRPICPELGETLTSRLTPGLDRGRVTLYSGIDCHVFFPKLYNLWSALESPTTSAGLGQSNPVNVSETLKRALLSNPPSHKPTTPVVLEGDVEDRPPASEVWVGREHELHELLSSEAKIVFVTGIGGQGKSTLVARYFEECQRERDRFSILVWRDCKEEREPFENQLASIVLKLSPRLSGQELAAQDTQSLIELFVTLIQDLPILLIFDNADHYVDLENETMTGAANALIQYLLSSQTKARVIFTCRPIVNYEHPLALSQPLDGLDPDSVVNLFAQRGATSSREEIEAARILTSGHAFWLDLLAIQVAQSTSTLTELLEHIYAGESPSPDSILQSIWELLHDRERTVLRAMAETLKPETEVSLADYLHSQLNYNRLHKTLRKLRALNLVVVKRRSNESDLLELHPLVRKFVRTRFGVDERRSYIDSIIAGYKRFIHNNKIQLSKSPTLAILEWWTENAELDLAAGHIGDALRTLAEAAHAFTTSAYPRDFCRVVRLLLQSFEWTAQYSQHKEFDHVFFTHVELLAYLGENLEVDRLLDAYETTVPNRDARFVRYCGARSFTQWVRDNFSAALEWARLGEHLKRSSNLDSAYPIEQQLALAERDAGNPEIALPIFLMGRPLSAMLDPKENYENGQASQYGNVGRCLHFMGQIEEALICYQKSVILLETEKGSWVRNQGYARKWIGELLAAREQFTLAEIFFRSAHRKWAQTYPAKAAEVWLLVQKMTERSGSSNNLGDQEVENVCIEWMSGVKLDSLDVTAERGQTDDRSRHK